MVDQPSIYLRLHSTGGQLILAACDAHLLGKKLEMGDLQFPVSENFYGGDLVNDETFLSMVSQVSSANIIGNHCVDILVKNEMINEDSILLIEDVKHVQIYSVSRDR